MDLIDRPRGLIKDFIYVKDKTLSKSFCDDVIKKFDEDPRQRDGIIGKDTNQRVDKSLKETKDIREKKWTVAEIPEKLKNRIVEITLESFEKDILKILDGSGYENAYYGF